MTSERKLANIKAGTRVLLLEMLCWLVYVWFVAGLLVIAFVGPGGFKIALWAWLTGLSLGILMIIVSLIARRRAKYAEPHLNTQYREEKQGGRKTRKR